jgi:hypothetical protein
MDFLSDLSPRPTRRSTVRPAGGRVGVAAGRGGDKSAARRTTKAAKADKIPMEYLIGGGVAAGILVILLLIFTFSGGGLVGSRGLSEGQRRHLFYEIFEAVDQLGVNDNCRQEFRRIEKKYGVNDAAVAKILNEGLSAAPGQLSNWRLPDFPEGTAAARANRKQWIHDRGPNGETDPLLRD